MFMHSKAMPWLRAPSPKKQTATRPVPEVFAASAAPVAEVTPVADVTPVAEAAPVAEAPATEAEAPAATESSTEETPGAEA